MQYRKTKILQPVEAAYLAGLIDGEGTVSLTRKHRLENRQLMVTVSSTEVNMLEYIRAISGVGRITKKRTYQSQHSPSFTYNVSNRQALDLLQQVVPYLKGYKAMRATLVLQHYIRLTPRNGRYSSGQRERRETFIQQFFALRSKPGSNKAILN